MYTIEKGICPHRKTRWSELAGMMEKGDSALVANSNEAIGLRWALKRRGKAVRQGVEKCGDKGGKMRVWCLGMMENDKKGAE